MIIGAQKAGTTSLKNYLGEHPQIITHPQEEFGYYKSNDEYAAGWDKACTRYFPMASEGKKVIAKSVGLYRDEDALQRLHQQFPQVKLVFILRDPVERFISAYQMECTATGAPYEPEKIAEQIRAGESHAFLDYLLYAGAYAHHLEMIYRVFPVSQVQLVRFSDLKKEPASICRALFHWLKVDADFIPDLQKVHNEGGTPRSKNMARTLNWLKRESNPLKRITRKMFSTQRYHRMTSWIKQKNVKDGKQKLPVSDALNHALSDYYHPLNQQLHSLTPLDISHWK